MHILDTSFWVSSDDVLEILPTWLIFGKSTCCVNALHITNVNMDTRSTCFDNIFNQGVFSFSKSPPLDSA